MVGVAFALFVGLRALLILLRCEVENGIQSVAFAVFHDEVHAIGVLVYVEELHAMLDLASAVGIGISILPVSADFLLYRHQIQYFVVDVPLCLFDCLHGVGLDHWVVENRDDAIFADRAALQELVTERLRVLVRALASSMVRLDRRNVDGFPDDAKGSDSQHLPKVE